MAESDHDSSDGGFLSERDLHGRSRTVRKNKSPLSPAPALREESEGDNESLNAAATQEKQQQQGAQEGLGKPSEGGGAMAQDVDNLDNLASGGPPSWSSDRGRGTLTRKKHNKSQEMLAMPLRTSFLPLRLTLGFLLMFEIVSTAITVVAFFLWTSPSMQYSDLVDNWTHAPITDIALVPSSEACPETYDHLQGQFFGTDYICDCGPQDIRLSACSSADTSCTNVRFLDSFDLPNWKDFKICVQRHSAGHEVNSASRPRDCSGMAGWKNCSSMGCFPEDSPCPLTSFSLAYGGASMCPEGTEATKAFPNAPSDSRFLCTSRAGPMPIVDILLDVGGKCLEDTDYNPYSRRNPQKGTSTSSVDLSTPPFPCAGSSFDFRFVNVEMRTIGAYFSDNKASFASHTADQQTLTYWTTNSYPVFYKFQYRPEIAFNEDCPTKKESLIEADDRLSIISRSQSGLAISNVVQDVFVNIPWIIWSCTRGLKTYNIKTSGSVIKSVLVMVGNTITLILISTSFYTIYVLKGYFTQASDADCSDPSSQKLFDYYSNELTRTLWMDVFVFAWNIITLLMELRQLIFLPTAAEQRKKEYAARPSEIELHEPRKVNFHEPARFQPPMPEMTQTDSYPEDLGSGSATGLIHYSTSKRSLMDHADNTGDNRSGYESSHY